MGQQKLGKKAKTKVAWSAMSIMVAIKEDKPPFISISFLSVGTSKILPSSHSSATWYNGKCLYVVFT